MYMYMYICICMNIHITDIIRKSGSIHMFIYIYIHIYIYVWDSYVGIDPLFLIISSPYIDRMMDMGFKDVLLDECFRRLKVEGNDSFQLVVSSSTLPQELLDLVIHLYTISSPYYHSHYYHYHYHYHWSRVYAFRFVLLSIYRYKWLAGNLSSRRIP